MDTHIPHTRDVAFGVFLTDHKTLRDLRLLGKGQKFGYKLKIKCIEAV